MINIRYADAPLGHEIQGVDLSALDDADFTAIEDAYDRYGVILFRGQTLTPDQQIAFSKRFGALDRYVLERYNMKSHPEIFVVSNVIDDKGEPIGLGDAGRYWHTDMWVKEVPPRGSMLYALEVPQDDKGEPLGDTCFSSTAAAYDALPSDLREAIEGREAVYSRTKFVDFRMTAAGGAKPGEMTAAEKAGMAERAQNIVAEITHPLVKRHPRTGRKCIYFSEGAISHIVGMDPAESDRVLRALHEHVLKPEFIYRHRWKVGDVILWDNCSCIHKAINDYEWPQRRLMHRTTLAHNPKAVAA